MRTVDAILASRELSSAEVRALLAQVLGVTRESLIAHPERCLSAAEQSGLAALVERRRAGEPMAYLLGRQEFYGLELAVSPAVLIPRPETEGLVDALLVRLADCPAPRVLDLGTGSGAIAIAFAHARPDARVLAVDVCATALAVARANAQRHAVAVEFLVSDWYECVAGRFDAVVANPPYVHPRDPHLDRLACEPRAALTDEADGLDCLRAVVADAPAHLAPGGWLLVEHGFDQAQVVRGLFERAGFMAVETLLDAAGHERLCAGRLTAVPAAGP